ncbi:MAG: IS110 family transposase [Candidatus Thermoplasmatota archaeon]|nr:IS110 family transposase [Candidatus Thermoplasmatota archaeon]
MDDIRFLVRYRRSLAEEITGIKNRVHAVLARYGITIEATDVFGKRSLNVIRESANRMRTADGFILADLMHRCHEITSRAEIVENQLASMGKDIPEVKKLMTMPGIGFYSALAIYSEIGDIGRFPDARHLSAYCGLVPRVDQSGDATYYGHITKSGPSILRFFLVNSVHTTVKISGTFKGTYRKLKKRIGRNKAMVAMARRLSVTIYNMLAKNQDFVDLKTHMGLCEDKADRMQLLARKAQSMGSESVRRLIDEGVITLQSNKLLS